MFNLLLSYSCETMDNICNSSPCQNGGMCVSMSNVRYKCDCPPQYTGAECEQPVGEYKSYFYITNFGGPQVTRVFPLGLFAML